MKIKVIQDIIDILRGKKNKVKDKNNDFPIRLSFNERNFLLNHIKGAQRYLEYGAGGSTFLALMNTNISKVISVESDANWLKYLRNWAQIRENESTRLSFIHTDIGKTGEWGVPLENSKSDLFPNYIEAPYHKDEKYDVIFIDGRFRVACALKAVLHAGPNLRILMHDFNDRPQYHCILEFLDIIDTADTMALFKVKENFDKDKLLALYEKYKYIYV